jgi:hypothetical protein
LSQLSLCPLAEGLTILQHYLFSPWNFQWLEITSLVEHNIISSFKPYLQEALSTQETAETTRRLRLGREELRRNKILAVLAVNLLRLARETFITINLLLTNVKEKGGGH